MFFRTKPKPVASHPAPPVAASRVADGQLQLPKPDWHQHRYPPAPVGVPLYDPDALLDLHPELTYSIRLASGLSDADFNRYYLQVARNYAHFVHVLPASRAHHHRNMGGMLRHGLEVASFALRRSDSLILGRHESPKQRFNDEAIWRFAMFVAAIGHDAGKVVADIEVFDHSGTLRWNPFEETLVEWGIRNQITTYHPQWSERRVHRAHEAMSAVLLSRLLDPLHFQYLATGAREILMHVATTVAGVATQENPLYAVVNAADHASVSASLGSDTRLVDGISVGISPAERFIEAAVRLLHDGWQVNQPGARVLVTDESAYLAWPQAFDDVKARLEREGVTGILTTPDQVAGLLIDTNFAVPKLRANGGKALYHRVAPDFKSVNVKMAGPYLKLASIRVLFASGSPRPIDVEEIDESPRLDPVPDPAQPDAGASGASPYPEGDIPFEDTPATQGVVTQPPEPPSARPPATRVEPTLGTPIAPAVSTPASTTSDGGRRTAPPGSTAAPQPPPAAPPSTQASAPPEQHAREYLMRQPGAAGQALLSLVTAINSGELVPGKSVFVERTDLLVSAAAATRAIAIDLSDLGDVLDKNGILIVDPKMPTTRTVRHSTGGGGALNCFRISARPAAAMRALIEPKVLEKLDGNPPAQPTPGQTQTRGGPGAAPARPRPIKKPSPAEAKPKAPPTEQILGGETPAPQTTPSAASPDDPLDTVALRERIHEVLSQLGKEHTLPEGIVRVQENLIGHKEALITYLKKELPEYAGRNIYAVAMTVLQFAPTAMLRDAGFTAGSKPYRYALRP